MIRLRILLIDDEIPIHRFLGAALELEGFEPLRATFGAQGLSLLSSRRPDAVFLDLGLPDMDGKAVLQRAREFYTLPILVLSARTSEREKIEAFNLGADDYIEKPFEIGELLARLKKSLRRQVMAHGLPVRPKFDRVEVDLAAHEAFKDGEPVYLTPKEYRVLELLVRASGRPVSHRELLETVWGQAHAEDTQYIRVTIRRLRQKIEPDPAAPSVILTENGFGYKMQPSS